jgi:hypothetical protein
LALGTEQKAIFSLFQAGSAGHGINFLFPNFNGKIGQAPLK